MPAPPPPLSHEHLIATLASGLEPVRRLPPPAVRAFEFMAMVGAATIILAWLSDLTAVERLLATTDMWLAAVGSTLTAALAALAAFHLCLPDRSPAWALLPLPPALIWVAASGLGCLRATLLPGTHDAGLSESRDCLVFILAVSAPLSAVLLVMLRRGFSLRPRLTAALGGLAAASAAATLLNFLHPFDATASDLAVHAAAVILVILANQATAGRLLASPKSP